MSSDIAAQLLHSTDARIAEAAKRVFSNLPSNSRRGGEAIAAAKAASAVTTAATAVAKASVKNTSTDTLEEEDRKLTSTERLKRSRERNRMHARKTRQRKKEHMQKLQSQADQLKLDQIRLKQAINEKHTASILIGLYQESIDESTSTDPRIDALLKRNPEDIPDASKIPELPALILPGSSNVNNPTNQEQEDGIDYKLLGKDRASCSPAELDKIRRERNRMHAKRTRDRKRIFMEEMEVMIRQLEEENGLLSNHLLELGGHTNTTSQGGNSDSSLSVSPPYGPVSSPPEGEPSQPYTLESSSSRGDFLNQIESLLAAAGAFEKRSGEINAISCAESDVTASTNNSEHGSLCEEEEEEGRVCKKQRMDVPSSITTTTLL